MPADRTAQMKADRDAHRTKMRASRSEWNSSMRADRDAHLRSARSESSKAESASESSASMIKDHSSDFGTDFAAKIAQIIVNNFLEAGIDALKARSERKQVKDTETSSASNMWLDADELKAKFGKLVEDGKTKMNGIYGKTMQVYHRQINAMAKNPCVAELKEYNKWADEQGSYREKCRSFMDKFCECRKKADLSEEHSSSSH